MHCLSLRLSFLNIHESGSSVKNDRILRICSKKDDIQPLMAPDDRFPVLFNLNERVYTN